MTDEYRVICIECGDTFITTPPVEEEEDYTCYECRQQ